MDLVNKKVTHKIFGKGRIIKYDDSYVDIDFPAGNKKFVFPDAFGKYLTVIDPGAAKFVEKKVQIREKELKKEKRRLEEIKALQEEKRQYLLERERLARKRRTRRIHPNSQSVFWCEKEELESVFTDWHVFTGVIKSGQRKGEPRRLARLNQNSACLLTIRSSDMPEKERRILGAFMVAEGYNGKKSADGYIPAHSKYRFRLSEEESEKMFFWKYYINERYPHKITWNTGRHRYFKNMWMAKILRDIVSMKEKGSEEQKHVEDFYNYFCQTNRINIEELPEPGGALTQD